MFTLIKTFLLVYTYRSNHCQFIWLKYPAMLRKKWIRLNSPKVPFPLSVITIHNEVAKVMFLQVHVCPRGGGVVVSQHALQVVFQHALQQVSDGGCYPSMHCRWIQACLVTGFQRGVCLGGLVSEHALKQTPTLQERRLLLQMVCIPLECILVVKFHSHWVLSDSVSVSDSKMGGKFH